MSGRNYQVDLRHKQKLIVGEGESDLRFLAAFCVANGIDCFEYAFTGMHSAKYVPSGFDVFGRYLAALPSLANFDRLTDVVIVCDTGDSGPSRVSALSRQIRDANRQLKSKLGDDFYQTTLTPNVPASSGTPRMHLVMLPATSTGGLETVCVDVARDHLNTSGTLGTEIEGWVDTFAASATKGWTKEKRDKLRLQAFISAAWKKKPEMHFSQLFDITGSSLVPLDSPVFADLRAILKTIAAL